MQIKGYDDWKLATPWDDKECCPFCGAYSTRSCELEEETEGCCPWEEMRDEPDPDYLRDLRNDR